MDTRKNNVAFIKHIFLYKRSQIRPFAGLEVEISN